MITEVIIVFVMAWWLCLFIALPIGSRPLENPEVGHDSGAPEQAHMKKKLIITTIVATLITILFFYVKGAVL